MTDAVRLMTGPQSAALLQSALTGEPGGTVPGFRCVVDRVHDRVGAETSVTYHVSYGEGSSLVMDYLVATTADVEGAATVEVEGLTVRVWRHPGDPRLAGLEGACTPAVLAEWLPEPQTGADSTELLVYRPLRRAVLRTRRGTGTWFTKVVRPERGKILERKHRMLAGLGPDVAAAPAPGVLITGHVPGVSLAVALSAWQLGESEVEPDPADALALLDRLPAEVVDLPARASWTDRVDFHAGTAAATLPEHAAEIRALGARIAELAGTFPVGPLVPTHGDFHEGNIFCEGGRPTRMIDIDTVGPGRREDDLACMVAHLAVLSALSPGHYPRGAVVADRWARAFEETVEHPGAFRIRVAGVLLSLVAGTDPQIALPRLDLARAWTLRATSP